MIQASLQLAHEEIKINFYCKGLGLKETRRKENEKVRYTLIFLAAPNDESAEVDCIKCLEAASPLGLHRPSPIISDSYCET